MAQRPKVDGSAEPVTSSEPRAWRTASDDDRVASPKGESQTGIKAFFRKLSMLFSLDPRSGSR
jgi:hypothetical protein